MNKWKILKPDESIVKELTSKSDISPLCARVLSIRNIKTVQEAADILSPEGFRSPFEIKDMKKAAEIIMSAVDNDELICIYGDYDCDGVTSTAMLYSYLSEMGAKVTYYIPERDEGYGMNRESIDFLKKRDVRLIITVDNGITAIEEAEYIKSLGIKLVITDHHQPLETIPDADAVVDVHQEDDISFFKYFCGAGIVFKLIAAIEDGDYTIAKEHFSEFAAIGTIGDVVRLTGENRSLVLLGLYYLDNTERPGLLALRRSCNMEDKAITSTGLAFSYVPRLNAAGRFGSPRLAVDLLLSESLEQAIMNLADINECNANRKKEEDLILNQIFNKIRKNPDIIRKRVLVVSGKNWHAGVIGIVASRLMETFGKPSYVISEMKNEARGSARAFGDFSVFGSLQYSSDILTKFGGHPGAGGFSLNISDISLFNEKLQKYAMENFTQMPQYTITADTLLMPEDITIENVAGLKILEPYGEGNNEPVFAIVHALVEKKYPLSENRHTKLRLKYGSVHTDALIFRKSTEEVTLNEGDICDILVTASINEYNGRNSVSLIVRDYRKSGIKQSSYFASYEAYEKYMNHEDIPKNYYQALTPSYNELVYIYKSIPDKTTDLNSVFVSLENINYGKLRIAVDIFCELSLTEYDIIYNTVKKLRPQKKADLNSSYILNDLKNKSVS